MKKKVLSLVMAIAMTLSLAAPAFAANYFTNPTDGDSVNSMEQSITFNAVTFVPTVKLYVPSFTGNPVVLNPYKIQLNSDNKVANSLPSGTDPVQDQYKQVVCPVYAIKNQTDAPLKYEVEATTTATGLTLQDAAVSATETSKVASLQLVVATSETDASHFSSGNYGNPANEQQLDQWDVSKFEVLKLSADAPVTSSDSIEKRLASGSGSGNENYLLFQFQGTMTKSPATAWTNSDKVDCVVKFTFTPDSANDYSVSSAIAKNTPALTITNDSDSGNVNGPSAITIDLPSKSGSGDVTKANMVAYGAPSATATTGVHLEFPTDPRWAVVSAGALTKRGLSISDGVLTIDPSTACTRLPKDGNDHDYKIVLSFNDGYNIPRTMDFKVTLKRASS